MKRTVIAWCISCTLHVFAALIPLGVLLPSSAATLERKKGKATLVLSTRKIEAGTLHIRLSDEIKVAFLVEGKNPLEVKISGELPDGAWYSESAGPAKTTKLENGLYRWRYAFLVEPNQPKKHLLALPGLQYREKGKDWQRIAWDPIPVVVSTRILNTDVSQIKEPPDIEELPPVVATWVWLWWTAGGIPVILVIAITSLLLLRVRRPRPLPPAPPEQIALGEIERLEEKLVKNSADLVSLSTQLADVIRTYLERKFLIPATQRTAAEFLELLGSVEEIDEAEKELAREYFHRLEPGKFAPVEVNAAMLRESIRQAKILLGV